MHPVPPRQTWIFGYGSLIWRPNFPYRDRVPARLDGWARRFWQGSPDHRGTPDRPGRVVTLLERPQASTWGAAYAVEDEVLKEVLVRLDLREVAGYALRRLTARTSDDAVLEPVLVYIAQPGNPSWLGPAEPRAIAHHAQGCAGRSGTNRDYVLQLASGLEQMGVQDPHVSAVATALHAQETAGGP